MAREAVVAMAVVLEEEGTKAVDTAEVRVAVEVALAATPATAAARADQKVAAGLVELEAPEVEEQRASMTQAKTA